MGRVISQANEWEDRIIPTVLEKVWKFPGTGPPPTFQSFMVSLGTVMVLVGV